MWTRALVFFVHNSTYAFSAIVAVYLLGIAAGSALAGRLARDAASAVRGLGPAGRRRRPACCWRSPRTATCRRWRRSAAGGRSLAGLTGGGPQVGLVVTSWSDALVVIFGQVAAVLFLPRSSSARGAFPLALAVARPGERSAAGHVGRLYVGALGCVLGALLGTFALVPLLGTRGARSSPSRLAAAAGGAVGARHRAALGER
ncbi:MAG: hypothetical protein U0599_27185 [Vicinamibacteria bacterium]